MHLVQIDGKHKRYAELIAARKACDICAPLNLTNPSRCQDGRYDDNGHIGPWTQWQGNLNAELMIVGQDWGGVDYYVDHEGIERDDRNITNKNLVQLLAGIGITIPLLGHTGPNPLYFTNAALCLRPGGLTGDINAKSFTNCGPRFLRQQIELVNPKVVVTLGHHAYKALFKSFGLQPAPLMRKAILRDVETLPNGSVVVPVYHCGNNGQRSRPLAMQKEDWKRVRGVLGTALP